MADLARYPIEEFLRPVLIQLAVIIAAARLLGRLARKVGQPAAVGEVVAGLLLGPSFFGWLSPTLHAAVFHPSFPGLDPEIGQAAFGKVMAVLAQIGLILILFLIGLEFDFSHLKVTGRAALLVTLFGSAIPFSLGVGLAPLIHPTLEPHPTAGPVPLVGMALFLGVALSVTAIPMLGRIMIEFGISRTRLAAIAIAAAAAGDAVAWIMLAAVSAFVKSSLRPGEIATVAGLTVAFVAVMIVVVGPILNRFLAARTVQSGGTLPPDALAAVLVAVLVAGVVTQWIGLFAVFGAFVLGATLSGTPALRSGIAPRLRDFTTVFFQPIFLTSAGLRTELQGLTATQWLVGLAIFTAALLGKLGGCSLAARLGGLRGREALLIGAFMNTHGLVDVIVLHVGYELGVVPKSLFAVLVLIVLATMAMTTPLVRWWSCGTEFEAPIRESGFTK
jgi:Kef-type K+ transport system membrane component KefB